MLKLRVFNAKLINKKTYGYGSATIYADNKSEAIRLAEKNFGYEFIIDDMVETYGPYDYDMEAQLQYIEEEEVRHGWHEDIFFGRHFVNNKERITDEKTRAYMGMRYQYGGY